MTEYFRVLKYPLAVWFIVDFFGGAVFPILVPAWLNISDSFTSLTAWSLPLGAIAGYKMIELKGNLFHALVAGVITAAWCAILTITEVGISSTPVAVMTTAAGFVAFGGSLMGALPVGFAVFIINFMGAIIGAGFALTRKTA